VGNHIDLDQPLDENDQYLAFYRQGNPSVYFAFRPRSTSRRMASETFGTGFCFDRHASTAVIISLVKPITFLTGWLSGRPIISHMPY
jgi:hypothetical protein